MVLRMSLPILSISLLWVILGPAQSAHQLSPLTIKGEGLFGTCPSQEKRDAVIQNITASIQNLVSNVQNNCGPGWWYQVATLNMSDPSQHCPSAWREYNTSGVRACGRPAITEMSCPGVFYSANNQVYSKVCGEVIGYQYGSTDAFWYSTSIAGVSITHGSPRNHIWSYVAGASEGLHDCIRCNCPCADPGNPSNGVAPSFLGDNYYCESGNPTNVYMNDHLYSDDPLWDGQQCEGECCSNGKSPPWFSVETPNPTTDDIEVRICVAVGTYDDVAVQVLKIYIQ